MFAINSYSYIEESTKQANKLSIVLLRETNILYGLLSDIGIIILTEDRPHIPQSLNLHAPEDLTQMALDKVMACIHAIEEDLH